MDPIDEIQYNELLNGKYKLADWTDNYDRMKGRQTKIKLREMVENVQKRIHDYVDLDSLVLPAIYFYGDEADLPEVYENLNLNSSPLTKYEIFNATWADVNLILPEYNENSYLNNLANEVLSDVKNYYNRMTDEGEFELEGFSEDEITQNRIINLAEFGRAIGTMVTQRIPSLISKNDDKIKNEIGFGILGIATHIDNKNLVKIDKKLSYIQSNLEEILSRVDMISSKLNDIFARLLRQNISFSKNRTSPKYAYSTGLTTSFKALSYFATLWEMNKQDTEKTIYNIPAYYVFDYLTGVWSGHGDQRLYDYYHLVAKKNYLKPLTITQFNSAFAAWLSENNAMRKTFSKEVKALITIHSNLTYLSGTFNNGEDFEFEHIIPKARALKADKNLSSLNLSSLGNGMFLPKSLNNRKQEFTIYEASNKSDGIQKEPLLEVSNYKQLIHSSDYFSEKEFENIFSRLKKYDFEYVNKKIRGRAIRVGKSIGEKLITLKKFN
ncbi:hypothetical protein AYR61_06915 [Secundilactobacillus paracollinoides]|uniref:DUF1524 domain-containing protein n=1 Tax=Secundilactobacillus paracollinoides TaxID=240427 RepID=A0A1B2IYB6_9LACO|nr:hypothetical protein AYR61_06915 [Secundilactobacillus paracollinoides]ANZ67019.1 hypothetical protein AYR63_07665 [Secundilactobacillus paracollinoides]